MRLVSIPRDGDVSLSGITLPEAATSVVASTVQLYARCGYLEPWVGYLAIEESNCVGCCGFTSPPVGGVAEIAYFTYPEFEKRGIATRMAETFAKRVEAEKDPVAQAVRLALGRDPSPREAELGRRLGLVSWCRVLLNLNEFVYLD